MKVEPADPSEMLVKVTPTGAHALVLIPKGALVLDSAGMETVAWSIVDAREAMQPRRSPTGFKGTSVSVPPGGVIAAEPRPERREVLIRMMHPGLGWIGVQLDRAKADALIEQIRAAFDKTPDAS